MDPLRVSWLNRLDLPFFDPGPFQRIRRVVLQDEDAVIEIAVCPTTTSTSGR